MARTKCRNLECVENRKAIAAANKALIEAKELVEKASATKSYEKYASYLKEVEAESAKYCIEHFAKPRSPYIQ